MDGLIKTGKRRTILVSISILLISIITIFFYHSVRAEIDPKKLVQQIIRFSLTVGLLVMVYKGKKWARTISLILFSLAILGVLIALRIEVPFVNKIPLITLILIYSISIYHFGFSKSFKAFFEFENRDLKDFSLLDETLDGSKQ